MLVVRSVLFNAAFYGWTAFSLLVSLPALALPYSVTVFLQRVWARGVMALMRTLVGIRFEVRGSPPAGAVLVAAKHQSAWDTIIWHVLFPHPAVVLKRELLDIPVYGWFCRKSRMIPVDRRGGAGALKAMLGITQRAIDAGRQIIIFPEGTRTAPGARVPYLPGVAAIYTHLGVETVPVAVNSGLYWPRRKFLRHPGTIVIEFLAPIAPGLDRRAFMAALEERIETASDSLCREAGAHRSGDNRGAAS